MREQLSDDINLWEGPEPFSLNSPPSNKVLPKNMELGDNSQIFKTECDNSITVQGLFILVIRIHINVFKYLSMM